MLSHRLVRAAAGAATPRTALRAAFSTTGQPCTKTPGMADISASPQSVEEFNKRQQAFREQLVDQQKQREATAGAATPRTALRAAFSTTGQPCTKTPGMADISASPQSVEEFNKRQQAFREQLVDQQKQREAKEKVDDTTDLKLRYYEQQIILAKHDNKYLEVCKNYRQVLDTEAVENDPAKLHPVLQRIIYFVILAPHDNEQHDLLHRILRDTRNAQVPVEEEILKLFTVHELMRWPEVAKRFGPDLCQTDVFDAQAGQSADEKAHQRWEDLRKRVIEHNVRVVAKYYTRIQMSRLTQLLDLAEDETEKYISDLVTSKTVLARGKYVHTISFHEVKQDRLEEYVDLISNWYPKMAALPENKVHLVGSWRTEIGDTNTFVHIWEYQRYQGYHESIHNIANHPEYADFEKKLRSLIHSRKNSLMQEFSFWPTTPPRKLGGIFELRSYTLHPGNLLEWETHWRRGLKARREVMEGVGAWFVQIGDLNTVHHLWQFANLEERKIRREQSWQIEGWSETVHKTVPLIQKMESRILTPMPWSPVQ
ncbi:hypothetical protein BN1723_011779 [Verticillium longisporum]|uniref:PCI domain-containing protein n=2 Tax=Verticillium longisporum TaxID=100787 RepID=A0A0G4LAQ0_VERLO|nr:hypothetical protein BN1723_011779 [Verticillium longisporum]